MPKAKVGLILVLGHVTFEQDRKKTIGGDWNDDKTSGQSDEEHDRQRSREEIHEHARFGSFPRLQHVG